MYCLAYTRLSLCTAALIFYTVVWLPLLQLKKSLIRFIFPQAVESSYELRLSAARFGDLQRWRRRLSCCKEEEEEEGAMCSICLVGIEEEEAVSQLLRCRHIFHWGCMEEWLERCQFTCPLCRSHLFSH
ncbi:hypothetical protein SAY87_020839 [Trapa incisa]|uniref:RING-type domain-containing protein n=1 Tax=Trapa incisa TaxID=236973 RepID=A0AAN7PPY1_9MYRT|nr:hypothetical protein SAY87_020839 [Trapa incisa]